MVAEMRSIAHKAISKRKSGANQALRRKVNEKLSAGLRRTSEVDALDPFVARIGRRSFKKSPDRPLSEFIGVRAEGSRRGLSSNAKGAQNPSALLKAGRRKALRSRGG